VLAVGIDSAEPRLVRDLIDRGELPALGRLREEGGWRSVRSPAHIGSGAVWPTFLTGLEPSSTETSELHRLIRAAAGP
jgi:predicted AlkP superfamily phosphohydrolase/phosphomutase